MKINGIIGIVGPLVFGWIGFRWIPLSTWIDMNQGLLAFLGLMAAALVQVIPVTTNFIQSDYLTLRDAVNLTQQLKRQQHYWIGLLTSVVFAVILVVIISVLKDVDILEIGNYLVNLPGILSGVVSAAMVFVLFRMKGVVEGVLSLQELRSQLVLEQAKRVTEENTSQDVQRANLPKNVVPEGYGQLFKPDNE